MHFQRKIYLKFAEKWELKILVKMQMGENGLFVGYNLLGELWTENGGKWVITVETCEEWKFEPFDNYPSSENKNSKKHSVGTMALEFW